MICSEFNEFKVYISLNMSIISKFLVYIIFFSLFLVSCGNPNFKRQEYTYEQERRIERYGEGVLESEARWKAAWAKLLGDETSLEIGTVDNILWNTALDKISFMPLNSVDKLSGTIITEWYNINPDQKIKINLFVNNAMIAEDSLAIKVFEEKLVDNIWVKSERNKDLELKIEKSILETATKLKIAAENL